MHLSEIWIYPVKSLGGIRLKESEVEARGLKYDRRWMVVDEKGVFLTQRTNPKMALIDVAITDKGLLLSTRLEAENQVLVPFQGILSRAIEVKIWDDWVWAHTISTDADAWLTAQLGKNVHIVGMSGSSSRKMNVTDSQHGDEVSFADDFPYLLISEASLADLNSRLPQPVSMRRFRPNFVVSDVPAFAEDSWNYITIGDVRFEVARPCERCVLINIDPKTALKETEPLKTLAAYRKQDRKILFGQNLVGLQNGTVREGDKIHILLIS
ncbi:MAG: MOSC N-terminal beta barrel domain-containing protein [Dyadobacter sp.]|uniref:MOSC domain-containing protein n=1 Tax=Dyadobacter sp. TaxID=1914288 RepID=UPI00326328C4